MLIFTVVNLYLMLLVTKADYEKQHFTEISVGLNNN